MAKQEPHNRGEVAGDKNGKKRQPGMIKGLVSLTDIATKLEEEGKGGSYKTFLRAYQKLLDTGRPYTWEDHRDEKGNLTIPEHGVPITEAIFIQLLADGENLAKKHKEGQSKKVTRKDMQEFAALLVDRILKKYPDPEQQPDAHLVLQEADERFEFRGYLLMDAIQQTVEEGLERVEDLPYEARLNMLRILYEGVFRWTDQVVELHRAHRDLNRMLEASAGRVLKKYRAKEGGKSVRGGPGGPPLHVGQNCAILSLVRFVRSCYPEVVPGVQQRQGEGCGRMSSDDNEKETEHEDRPDGFFTDDDRLMLRENGKVREISAAIEVIGSEQNLDTRQVHLVFRFAYAGGRAEAKLLRQQFTPWGIKALRAYGADVHDENCGEVWRFLNEQEKKQQPDQFHDGLGWREIDGAAAFLHRKGIGTKSRYCGEYGLGPAGTMKGWKRVIRDQVLGRPLLELGLGIGLTSPLIRPWRGSRS